MIFFCCDIKRLFLLLCFFLIYFKGDSQESRPVFEEVWFQYYNTSKFIEKLSLSTDGGYSLKEGSFFDVSQYFIRSGLTYHTNSSVKVLLGAAYFKSHFHGKGLALELRPYQQLTSKHKLGKIGFGNRFRIEERFRNTSSSGRGISTFNFRFRYRFLLNFPLLYLSKSNKYAILSVIVGDEILFGAGKGDFLDFTAQNRFLLGPVIDFNKNNKLLLLYNFTSVAKDIPDVSDEFGVLWIGYKQTFDFRR